MSKLFSFSTAVIALLALLALLTAGCSDNDPQSRVIHVLSGPIMGTSYQVKVVAEESYDLQTVGEGVQAILQRVDRKMSTYKPDSELSRFNQAPENQWFELSEETLGVISLGQQISDASDGAFDITVGPLVNLWGFGPDGRILKAPSDDEIEQARQRVGSHLLELRTEPPALLKTNKVYIDLSALAKGYAVDQVAEYLSESFDAYLVEVGGELRAHGVKPDGSNWKIAVESPLSGTREVQEVLSLSAMSIATSGDYRNYFEEDGVRYSHTIDPKTGRPIKHRLASVTVLDPSCAKADAWATAMMALGETKGLALAERLNMPVFFIVKTDEGFKEVYTPAFADWLKRQ